MLTSTISPRSRGRAMLDLLRQLAPLRLAPVSPDTDRSVDFLCSELPFEVHEYASGTEHNAWIVPMNWYVRKAEIRRGAELLYDGLRHPLGVIGYSQSFTGRVDLEELKQHLFYSTHWPNALVYHCDLFYKVGRRDWGFSVPRRWLDTLADGEYDVDLVTVHEPGRLKVCDYFLPGETGDTIVLNAHNCHAAQANDDISGTVVGVEVMKRLRESKRRYSYRLIVAPEHFGTVFYLSTLSREIARSLRGGVFLEALGNDRPFSLQRSFLGDTEIDRAAEHYLTWHHPDHSSARFRAVVGNDETVWESAGFEVPTISLSRFPFPEYHTSMDNEDIILEERLEESVDAVVGILDVLDTNCAARRCFEGLVALSNPRYDLYLGTEDPSIRIEVGETQKRWNHLMDCVPRYFDGRTRVLDIAIRHGLRHDEVYTYLSRFRDKGLIEFLYDKQTSA
jgi:aminopeptidase-like protein